MNAIYTESISDFRNNYDAALKKLAQGPVLLLQRSKPAAVLVEPESWNQIAEEMQALRAQVERLTEEIAAKLAVLMSAPLKYRSSDFTQYSGGSVLSGWESFRVSVFRLVALNRSFG